MPNETNDLKQPVGVPVADWTPPPFPQHKIMEGRFCRLEPLSVERHAANLYRADSDDREGASWTYLPYGPFVSEHDYIAWMEDNCFEDDPQFYAIVDLKDDSATGVVSHLRINPRKGSIEVGHVHYSPRLQKTPAATEAIYLLMSQAFELSYRRYEWKCHALNAASRAAARRLGFSFEGIFRQAAVVKGRNRDTAWHAIIDAEWQELQRAFERWLSPSNFDDAGQQKERLSTLTAPVAKGHTQ